MSRLGKISQATQRARRLAGITPEMLQDMTANPPLREGDTMRSLEWRNIQSGEILRWTFLRGPRRNNYRMRTPDGRLSKSHGMAWFMVHLRPIFLAH